VVDDRNLVAVEPGEVGSVQANYRLGVPDQRAAEAFPLVMKTSPLASTAELLMTLAPAFFAGRVLKLPTSVPVDWS